MPAIRSSLQQERQKKRRKIIWTVLSVAILGAVITSIAFLKPRKINCITSENTFCPKQIETAIQTLSHESFWTVPQKKSQLESEIHAFSPEFLSLDLMRTPTTAIEVVVHLAQPLFPVQIDGESFIARNNGTLTPEAEASSLPLIIRNTENWDNLSEKELLLLQKWYKLMQRNSLNFTKLEFISLQELRAWPEGKNVIILRADDEKWIQRQLNTLQAFFHSTTIAETYQELDVRFSDLIVK